MSGTKREKRLADKSVMTNYDAAEVADASAEAAAEEGREAEPDAAALAEETPTLSSAYPEQWHRTPRSAPTS